MKLPMASCGGCRTCEIACSFHHRGEFVPSISSLKIIDNPEGSGYTVLIVEETDSQSLACDGCKDLDVPLCVEYCTKSEDLEMILEEYLGKVRLRSKK